MTKKIVRLELPWPPTGNTYYRNLVGRTVLSKRGRQYRRDVMAVVLKQLPGHQPITEDCKIAIRLYPPTRQKRDADNHLKAIFDSLQNNGVVIDDCQFKRLEVDMCDVLKGGAAVVTVTTL